MKKNTTHKRTILGLTMSKQGWNNVIIYAVLLLMFGLYFTNNESRNTPSAESIEPFAEQIMVELSDRNQHLVRVGNRWQSERGDLSEAGQQRWLKAWQQLRVVPYEGLLDGQEYIVEITLADTPQPLRVAVFFTSTEVLLALPGYDHIFRVVNQNPDALRPNG